jgi:hypothetical protein
MAAHGHTTTWGTHIGVGRATDAKGWYAPFKTWWAARQSTRPTTLSAQWDARREAVRAVRADAAIDMVAPTHMRSTATAFCDLGV